MPQNPEFTLNSDTLGVVYKDIGVLAGYASDSAKMAEETHAILGAYYEPNGEYKGLYFVLPEGEVKYFDVDVAKLASEGAYLTFEAETKLWVIRQLSEEDGLWLSSCKVELPTTVLAQLITARSKPALSKYLGVDLPDDTPEFEAIYAYFSDSAKNITALNYISTAGTYSRIGYEWKSADLSMDYYEDLSVVEISPEHCQELVDNYDETNGVYPTEDAIKFSVEVAK